MYWAKNTFVPDACWDEYSHLPVILLAAMQAYYVVEYKLTILLVLNSFFDSFQHALICHGSTFTRNFYKAK